MNLVFEQIDEIFQENGILAKIFTGYQPRKQQIELAKTIYQSFVDGRHLFAEAGTGTGKSFAYLIASALWSLQHEGTVLISTNTLPLQSQLMEKDLPIIKQVMQYLGYDHFVFELAKGRSHYICKRRLENLVQTILAKESEHREIIEKLAIYSYDAKYGSRDEFPFSIPQEIWEEVCGDSDDCFHQHSPFYESCFIQNARKRWSKAHLIVANHALVFSDLALKTNRENGVLPKYDRLVFDEGHRVEEVFSRFFERSVSLSELERTFRLIRQRKQGWMRSVFDDEILKEIEEYYRLIYQAMFPVFDQLANHLSISQQKDGISSLAPVMSLIEEPIDIPTGFEEPIEKLVQYLQMIGELKCSEEPEKRGMSQLIQRVSAFSEDLKFIANREGGDDWAHWIEKNPPLQAGIADQQAEWVKVIAQPIQARTVLRDLFAQVPVTLTSATMSTNHNFEFLATRLGLSEYDQFIADSPFDYEKNALLVISETAPDPRNAEEFERFLIEGLKRILAMTKGRTLVLFTSFATLENVAKGLAEWSKEHQIELLLHTPKAEREQLIKEFKAGSNRVLFGCDSFWEGIDLPGDELSCVVLTKIPFANPSEPLVRAKVMAIEKNGGNSFSQYMIPTAILKMKQGFGRLIRSVEDRGSVIIMDSRILKKYYGKQILSSLPTAKRGKIKEICAFLPND